MATTKFYTEDEALDKVLGKEGTLLRNQYESDMNAFLTQEELGTLIGVKKSQVSRIEKGNNITFATIAKVFRAMGISASFEMAGIGKVALW